MATLYAKAAGGNWSAAGTWSNVSSAGGDSSGPPTAADDAVLDAGSGNVTVDSGAVCRSLDCNGYTGTLSGSNTITIGDATAGVGNVALRLSAGMTTSSFSVSFVSSSSTTQTITSNGNDIPGNLTVNNSSGKWQLTDGLTVGSNFTMTAANTFDTTTSSAPVTCNASAPTFSGGGKTYFRLNLTGAGTPVIGGTNTFTTLDRTGTAVKTSELSLTANQTVTGELILAGNSAINRLLVKSGTVGTSRTITNAGATMTWSNVDFQDISLSNSFDASAITGNSGDCGGNSGITFTTGATQTWSGTSGGNWSTNAWTSRVPLPQDDVTINAAFSASQTVTSDMPRLGKSISWTGATGSPTWNFGSTTNTIYGSITLITGMTLSGTQSLVFAGRGSFTITSAGRSYTMPVTFAAIGGTYTLNDGMSSSSGSAWTLTNGTFVDSGYALSWSTYNISGSATRAIVKTGAWDIFQVTGTTVWTATTTTNLTYSDTGTISIITTTANSRIFAGGGLTYGTLIYTLAGSTGKLTITGANSFAGIQFSDANNARTLNFTASTITTIRSASGWQVNGTAGKLMTVSSSTAAIHTISCASGTISSDYLDLSYSTATGGASFYAGANTTNSGNNSGWTFTAPTSGSVGVGNYLPEIELVWFSSHITGGTTSKILAEVKREYFIQTVGLQGFDEPIQALEIRWLRTRTGVTSTRYPDMWREAVAGAGLTPSNSIIENKINYFKSVA